MYKKLLMSLVFCVALVGSLMAQKTITGTVTDATDGQPIPGVAVREKGTTMGAITDLDGKYSLKVKEGATLIFSFVGLVPQEIVVTDQTVLDVQMKAEMKGINEVVVTALGIKRDKATLGYATSSIKADELVKNGNPVNPLTALYGKSAGVRIASTSGGPTSGMIINIRNTVSLASGSNTRPLFVVDGIPIVDKNTGTNENDRDGRDRGTGINDINAEDIESIDILKGAKAAVLYGSGGANGVVLITTKNGSKKKGLGVEFGYSYTWDNVAFTPDFQNEFGSGGNVAYSNVDPNLADAKGFKYEMINGVKTPVFFNSSGSFGPKMDGTSIYWYDKTMRPYNSQENNYKDLFNQGHLRSTNFAISNAGDYGSFRFSYSNKNYESVVVGADQQNHILSFTGSLNPNKYIKINFNSNYYYTKNHNAPFRMQSFATYGIPRDMKVDLLRDNITDASGVYSYFPMNKDIANRATSIISGTYAGAYFWNQTQNTYDEIRDHFIQSVNLNAKINSWLNFTALSGFDFTKKTNIVKMKFQKPMYLDNKQGYYSQMDEKDLVFYSQGMFNFDIEASSDFRVSGSVGGAYRYNSDKELYGLTKNFVIENLFQFNNSSDVSPMTGWGDEGDDVTYSAFASATLSFRNYLYLDLQGRSDWASILPPNNHQYFYPGASLSWIVSETFKLPEVISFAKLRASWADVGRAGQRYFGNISFQNGVYGTIPYATASGSLPPATVKDGKLVLNLGPERKREAEIGFDINFLNNRIGLEFSGYKTNMYEQIMSLTVPSSSGVNDIKVNAGDIQNLGWELQLKGTPVQTNDLVVKTTVNLSHNKTEIKKLASGVTIQPLWGVTGAFARAKVGGEYGEIYIAPWKRNAKGELITENGLYAYDKENLKKVGVTLPKILGGVNLNVSYKRLTLDADIDMQFGGTLISQTNMYGLGNGTFKESLKYRDEARGGLPYYVNNAGNKIKLASHTTAAPADSKYTFIFHDGVILPGVKADGTPNDVLLCAQEYYEKTYWQGYMDITEDVVYKSDYVSLRRLTLSYDLPKNIAEKVHVQNARVGVFGYNLAYLYKALPNVTPESTSSTNEFVEYSNMPGVRVFGFEVKLGF
jgi:TonB-linked SusC/RagA family outer membrane protein